MHPSDHRGAPHKAFETGRYSAEHILAGLALAGGAILVSSWFARSSTPTRPAAKGERDPDRLGPAARKPPPAVFALIWPPLFTALTLSGLRIWNAPSSRRRTRALTLWSLLQGFNALWMALGPRRLGGRLTTAVATAGTAAAFAWQARGLEPSQSDDAAPPASWTALASGVTAGLRRRRHVHGATVH